VAAAGVLLAAACGDSKPPGGPGPTVNPPQIACPVDVNVTGVSSPPQAVTYAPPTVTEGAQPVNTTCSPVSGSTFPLGSTPVTCAATDAMSRRATCSFNVTVKGMSLSVMKYDAFGDSLTEGETGRPNLVSTFLDTPNAYPTKLQQTFDAIYPGQATVINDGKAGDTVEMTLEKVIARVPVNRPGAVLLLSGYNNLTGPCGPGSANTTACGKGIEQVQFGIRDCIRRVREANAGVRYTFVSTLTPPGASGSNRIDGNAIVRANDRIKQVVAAEGAVLVDSYSAFLGHEAEYVNVDGLHLKPAGNQALSDAFFAVIQKTVPQTPLFGFSDPR
jgi:lysophospholipase L1-like esterase